jgi:type IV pilus assembly protein PilY1
MNSLPASPRRRVIAHRALLACQGLLLTCFGALGLLTSPAHAATPLADQPLFATPNVPGNLALLLSVEFPTAVSVAHTNRTYSPANEYLGYFDPGKCYDYYSTNGTDVNNYFRPTATASNRTCTSKWSGNFLNWASMQTIDPFRWALTGGYRVIDSDVGLTVIEKAWASGQGGTGNFPDGILTGADIAGATPFPATTPSFNMRIQGLGNKMRFTASPTFSFTGKYYNTTNRTGGAVLTRADASINFDWSTTPPSGAVNQTNMSVRWTGSVTAPSAGDYKFRIRGDDNVKLSINGSVVVNQTNSNGSTNYVAPLTYTATAGQVFTVQVDFVQFTGNSSVVLEWLKPGATEYVVTAPPLYDDVATPYTTGAALTNGVVYEVFVRAKVCDPSFLETNCTAYGANYKPEGLMQKYSNKIRYSAFGYLNDSSKLRDGGVLRARQKFVGPTQPRPGSTAVVNPSGEWDATTGQFTLNPDATDAANTAAIMGLPTGPQVTNSGVINYLNKFGEVTPGSYKTFDNVSELYYAAIRYFKNQGSVPEWTNVPAGTSDATKIKWIDGFPVIITSPDTRSDDPILYSCQRNFILGLGDVNTHADKNVPGNTQTADEPTIPPLVSGDGTVNAVDATNRLGVMEGLGTTLGTTNPYNGCCTHNSALIAGLAYDSHIKDIRPDVASKLYTKDKQTIDTYWVDVQEYQAYKNKNQFYLATKYGGFTVPDNYDPNRTLALDASWWHTNTDTFGTDDRPDNYYSGGRPDLMKSGLEAAFAKIAAASGAYTTSFSTSVPQVADSGNSSFSSEYDPKNWTGELTASTLSFDATASKTTIEIQWGGKKFSDILAAQVASGGWATKRRVVTWGGISGSGVEFLVSGSSTQIPAADLAAGGALDPSYVTGNDAAKYVDYLRGDQSNEVDSTATGSTKAYRARTKLVGDIVGSKVTVNGPPSFPFSDATNPGYAAFKAKWAPRLTTVFVGANDGMLHAINGALAATSTSTPPLETSPNFGQEMFAYIPRALFQGPTAPNTDGLASLGNPSFAHHYMVNATPNVADLDFARVPADSKAKQTPAAGVSDWRSVLIGGLGKGGKAYYALDVTDPESMAASQATAAEKVLWEFSNATTDMNGELGFTYGDPLMMKTKKYGWVVMFTSGYNNADGKGYFLFVNPKTGALLEKVSTGVGSPTSDAGLARAEAFIVDATDGTADAVYAGDLLGNVWRLDVTSTTGLYSDAGKLVKFAVLTDASAANAPQPVTARPSVEVHPKTKVRFVMVGTGRLLAESDIASTQGQTFYVIADGSNAAFNAKPFPNSATSAYPIVRNQLTENTVVTDETSFDAATKVGWYEELGVDLGTPADTTTNPPTPEVPATGIAYRVVSDSTAASGSISFASILPSGSVCSPSGSSRVYARNFATAKTTLADSSSYYSFNRITTDLRFSSVNGKLRLIAGTEKGGAPTIIPTTEIPATSLRRLNWRELQVVE